MAEQIIGHKIPSFVEVAGPDTIVFSGGIQLTSREKLTPPSNGWATKIGGWFKLPVGLTLPSKVMLGIYEVLPGDLPGRLIARTDPLTILANPATPENHGSNLEGPIKFINPEFKGVGKITNPQAVYIEGGVPLFLVAVSTYYVTHPFHAPSPASFKWMYRSGIADGVLTNPFGTATYTAVTTLRKPFTWYFVFNDSTKPTVALTSPAIGASVVDNTPTFQGTFADGDVALYGDSFYRYEIEVRRVDNGSMLWTAVQSNTLTSPEETAANAFAKTYTGAVLPAGVPLEWRARVSDRTGEWSDWAAWRAFSLAVFGVVDIRTTATPSGHVDGNNALIDWSARWYHTGNLAADRVQVRVLDANSAVLKTGLEVVKSVAAAIAEPGTLFTIQDTEAGIGTLPEGQALKWQIRARSTDGIWHPYSDSVDFRTNARPTVPVLLEPANGSFHTARPFLRASSRDIDTLEDPPLTGVVWDFEVTEIATSTVRTQSSGATYDSVGFIVSLLSNPTLVPNFGAYSWRVRGRDVSAGSFGESAWSTSRTFTLSDGPVVTISDPIEGEVLATTAVRVEWTTSEPQTSFNVQLYPVIAGIVQAISYQSGVQLSTSQFWSIPVEHIQNNKSYMLKVIATNSLNQAGTSLERRFSIFFTGAQALADVNGVVVARLNDVEPTTPALTWTKSTYTGSGEFRAYIVRRWETSKGESTAVTLSEITNINQLTFYDYHAPPNVALTYALAQRIQSGPNTLTSEDVTVELTFRLTIPIAVSVKDPANVRFPFMWLDQDYGGDVELRLVEHVTWEAEGLPTFIGQNGGPETRRIGIVVRNDQYGSMISKFHRIKNAAKKSHMISLRDESERLFMVIKRAPWKRGNPGTRSFQLEMKETSYAERATV